MYAMDGGGRIHHVTWGFLAMISIWWNMRGHGLAACLFWIDSSAINIVIHLQTKIKPVITITFRESELYLSLYILHGNNLPPNFICIYYIFEFFFFCLLSSYANGIKSMRSHAFLFLDGCSHIKMHTYIHTCAHGMHLRVTLFMSCVM